MSFVIMMTNNKQPKTWCFLKINNNIIVMFIIKLYVLLNFCFFGLCDSRAASAQFNDGQINK